LGSSEADEFALFLRPNKLQNLSILFLLSIVTAVLRGKWTKILTTRSFDKEEMPFQSRTEVAEGDGRHIGCGKILQLNFVCTKFLSL
jgi:hypothetical protein